MDTSIRAILAEEVFPGASPGRIHVRGRVMASAALAYIFIDKSTVY